MAEVKLVVDGAKMAELLRGPNGPVFRHVVERATAVQMEARAKAPRRTGCLQDSIVKRVEENPLSGFAIRIVADTTPCSPERKSYALYVELGTKPHDIPGAFGYALPFGIGGRFDGKFHPGTRGVHFLRDALPLAAL